MTIQEKILEAGIPVSSKDSVRRAIEKILARSQGQVPHADLQAILKIVVEAM